MLSRPVTASSKNREQAQEQVSGEQHYTIVPAEPYVTGRAIGPADPYITGRATGPAEPYMTGRAIGRGETARIGTAAMGGGVRLLV